MSLACEDRECTENCKSLLHGNIICAALTKRGISNTDLRGYIKALCCCCETVRDSSGRTALQVAASCGRLEIVKWLLSRKYCNINERDYESGYSALHRSLFYGKIDVAVTLLKSGANISQLDSDSFTVLEHVMKDQRSVPCTSEGDIYVWGSNTNYTLGPQQARLVPELMDIFHKENPQISVKLVCLSKFHCVIVSTDGRVFSSGHGQGGRLGLSGEHTVLIPKPVRFSASGHSLPVVCTQASIAEDHSVFLTESGHIWSCGLNTHRVLGMTPPPPQVLNPRPLNLLQHPIEGICAVKYHTVAWGPNAIYTWGLHGGQLGHDKNGQKYVVAPKLIISNVISGDSKIKTVASSTGAIAILTSKRDIYVLHEYQCRKIAGRQLEVVDLDIIGGTLDSSVESSVSTDCHKLQVLARTENGNLLLWQETDPQLSRCIFSLNRLIVVRQAILNTNRILFVTSDGEAFEGEVRDRRKKRLDNTAQSTKSAFHKFLERDDCRIVKICKIPRVHRAISIASDLKGKNFAVVQTSPRYHLSNIPEIPPSDFQEHLQKLFEEIDETDQIHDVTFRVKHKLFPAHRYILGSSSSKLLELVSQENSRILDINDVHHEIFYQMLIYVYTGQCDLLKCGVCPIIIETEEDKKRKSENPESAGVDGNISAYEYYKTQKNKPEIKQDKPKDPVRMLQECAKKFGVLSLQKELGNYFCQNGIIKKKEEGKKKLESVKTIAYDRSLFPEFYDVRIKTKNGKEIMAHKCVLVARMEYFSNMFSLRWHDEDTEVQEISLPFPFSVVEHLIEFLYSDKVNSIDKEDLDHICSLLVVADEFFIARLKEYCEYVISTIITLKNVSQIITFSNIYNAKQLKNCCLEFICLNLAALLECGTLDDLEETLLSNITEFYCGWNPIMCQRIITPYSTAPSDEEVVMIAQANSSINEDDHRQSAAKIVPKRKSRSHRTSAKASETEKENSSPLVEISIEPRLQFEPEENVPKEKSSPVPARLQAIAIATKKVQLEGVLSDFCRLTSSLNASSDFPELGSPPTGTVYSKSPKTDKTDYSKLKVTKLSQKQRKRLSSENCSKEISDPIPESPKNPWKVLGDTSSPVGSPECKIDVIMSSEKKQKEIFSKMMSKPLINTQKEDKAIEDLYKFYNAENVFDEIIFIERVHVDLVVAPVWVQKNK